MSATVDSRVVEMQFNNKQFEQNANQSIKTLDKLNSSLDLKGSTEGFDALQKSIKAVDLGNINSAMDAVTNKISMIGVIGDQVLRNLTNKVVDFGTRWVKSLSIDQINAGFAKYASKTESVQTIMNATGKTIDEVSAVINKLNQYTDETSYSFAEMVNSIGKFTSAGVDLDVAETAMEGIANWAAKAGVGIDKANGAFYNLSQAIGSGALKMQDWKSIENLNMATRDVKEQFIEAGIAAGTLKKQWDGTIITAKGWTKVTVNDFNNSLQKGWINQEVLLNTLKKYADRTTEFGLAAFHAAQEAKTFKDAIEATKDAVSTGWMNIFEKIFGNYEEARVLWTNVANELIEAFTAPTEALNSLLGRWHNYGGYQAFVESLENSWISLKSIVTEVAELFNSVFPGVSAISLTKATEALRDLTQTWRDFTTKKTIDDYFDEERLALMEKQGIDLSEVYEEINEQNKQIDENLSPLKDTVNGLLSVLKLVKTTVGGIFKLAVPFIKLLGPIARVVSAITADLGRLTTKIVDTILNSKALNVVFGYLQRTVNGISRIIGIVVDDFADFINNMKDLPAVKQFSKLLGSIWQNIENLASPYIKKAKAAIEGFLDSLESVEKEDIYNFINGVAEKLMDFAGVAIEVASAISDYLAPKLELLSQYAGVAFDFLRKKFEGISNWVKEFIATEEFQTLKNEVTKIVGGIAQKVKSLGLELAAFIREGGLLGVFKWLVKNLTDLWDVISHMQWSKVLQDALTGIEAGGFLAAALSIYRASRLFKTANDFISGLPKTLKSMTKGLGIKRIATSILMLAGAIYLLSQVPIEDIWTLVGAVAALGLTLTVLTLGMSLAQGFFSKMGLINNKAMLTAAASMIIMAGAMLMLAKATAILGDIPAKNLERAMSSLLGIMIIMTVATIAIGAAGTGIKALGIGLLAIAAAILILIVAFDKIKGYLESLKLATEKNAIVNALYIMAGLVVALITLSIVMKKVSAAAWETAAVILATGLAVYLLAAAAKKLLDLDNSKLLQLAKVLLTLVATMTILAAVARIFPKDGGKALLGMASALAGLGASVLMMVYAISLLGKMDASVLKKGIKNLGEIMALIATVMLSSAFTRIKGGAFVGLALAVVAIVGILKYLSNQSYGSFSASARMLGNVLLALGSSLAIGGNTLKKAKLGNMISTIGLVLVVAGALWLLTNYTNYADLKGAANILCATFVGLAAAMRIGASGLKAATWAGMVTSVLMVIFVAAALYFLASMPLGGLIAAAAAMGIVLETLADSMTRMNVGTMGLSWSRIGPSLVMMIGMMAVVYESLYKLAGYSWSSLIASATALSMVIGALSGSVTLLSKFKVNFNNKGQIIKTLAMMAGIITIAGAALWAMAKAFEKVDTSTLMEIATSVGVLMLSLAAVTAAFGAIGTFIKPAAVLDGLLGMAEVIAGIALLFTAVWAIDAIVTGANGDLVKGIERVGEVLTAIASVLGEVIGAFVVGIGVGFSEGLPTIATNFSTFVDTIVPAAEKFSGLSFNSEGIEAIKNFATAILIMTAADVLDALTSWLPERTDPIQKFAEDMTALGPSLKRFAFSMTGVNLKALSIGSQAISLLGDVASKMPYVDGLIQEVTGKPKSLGDFANELYTMIEGPNGEEGGLIKFANACPGLVDKIGAMNQVADVISSLGDIANAMNPKTTLVVGDWLTYQETAGDLKAFAEQLPAVAESITTFASKIDIPSDFPTKTQNVIDALQPLSELALALSDETKSYAWGAYKTTTDSNSGFLKFAMGLGSIADTIRAIGQRISPEDLRKFESVGRVFKGFADASSAIVPGLNDTAFISFCQELYGGASTLVSAGEQWAQVKFDEIETGLSRLGELVSIKQTEFEGWGTDVAGSLVDGFESSLEESTPGMVSKTVAKLSSSIEATIDMFSVGQDAVQGFIDGALSMTSEVVRAGIVIGSSFSGGVRSSLDVNSPSRVLMEIGSYVGEGFVLGVQKWNDKSEQAGYNLTEPLVNSASLALDYVRELMSGETDVDMTIRPVMDLTDVNNGMATISSLFSQRQAVMAQIDAEATTDRADIDELVEVGWKILKEIQNGSDLYLDDKVLAGRINRRLGQV